MLEPYEVQYIKDHPLLSTPAIAEVLGHNAGFIMEAKRCVGYDRLNSEEIEKRELEDWIDSYQELWEYGR